MDCNIIPFFMCFFTHQPLFFKKCAAVGFHPSKPSLMPINFCFFHAKATSQYKKPKTDTSAAVPLFGCWGWHLIPCVSRDIEVKDDQYHLMAWYTYASLGYILSNFAIIIYFNGFSNIYQNEKDSPSAVCWINNISKSFVRTNRLYENG